LPLLSLPDLKVRGFSEVFGERDGSSMICSKTAWSTPMDSAQIKALVEKALEDKILTLEEHGQIIDAVLADGQISEEEEKILHDLLERVASGEVDSQY
jgi:hypothetical protein